MSETLVKKEERPSEVATVERTRSGQTYSPRFDIWEGDNDPSLPWLGRLHGAA